MMSKGQEIAKQVTSTLWPCNLGALIDSALAEAVQQEREACAQIVESDTLIVGKARAIRERSNSQQRVGAPPIYALRERVKKVYASTGVGDNIIEVFTADYRELIQECLIAAKIAVTHASGFAEGDIIQEPALRLRLAVEQAILALDPQHAKPVEPVWCAPDCPHPSSLDKQGRWVKDFPNHGQ